MEMELSTTRALQKVLARHRFSEPASFSEDFAQKRFLKKFQVPNASIQSRLADECWQTWLDFDGAIPKISLPPKEWYLARATLHKVRPIDFSRSDVVFPSGSEFEPTRGANSVEARLAQSKWTVTEEAFELFCTLTRNHRALKSAVRRRFIRHCLTNKVTFDDRNAFATLKKFGYADPSQDIWEYKVRCVTKIVRGSRFSTVPKNNEKRRPINIEPFGNVLLQRMIGNHLRCEIKRLFGVDLDTLADVHRRLISDVDNFATIDLSNASDSVGIELIKFLFPRSVVGQLEDTRSPMVFGPDGHYHVPKKISSMGNGFTFELLTLVLLSVCRAIDPNSSVFGDDIIIHPRHAERLMVVLGKVGFQINADKSFWTGPFRESCGANYHRDEGYIESYDFLYPESIGDCLMIWNKVVRLATVYPSFMKLKHQLARALPEALHGGPDDRFLNAPPLELIGVKGPHSRPEAIQFPNYFVTKRFPRNGPKLRDNHKQALRGLGYDVSQFHLVRAYTWVPELRSKTRRHLDPTAHWAKFLMYLASGRRASDTITGSGGWTAGWAVRSRHWTSRANDGLF